MTFLEVLREHLMMMTIISMMYLTSSVLFGILVEGHNNVYQVRYGPWGFCEAPQCGPGGTQRRQVACLPRNLTPDEHNFTHLLEMHALPMNYCKFTDISAIGSNPIWHESSHQQNEQREHHQPFNHSYSITRPPYVNQTKFCFKYCEYHRFTYSWAVGAWSPCRRARHRPLFNDESFKRVQNGASFSASRNSPSTEKNSNNSPLYGLSFRKVSCSLECQKKSDVTIFHVAMEKRFIQRDSQLSFQEGRLSVSPTICSFIEPKPQEIRVCDPTSDAKEGNDEKRNNLVSSTKAKTSSSSSSPFQSSDDVADSQEKRRMTNFQLRSDPKGSHRYCVHTDFSQPSTCQSCWDVGIYRYRTVLIGPSNEGRQCHGTALSHVEPCPERSECREPRHTNFKFKIGAWMGCSGDESSVIGHKRRSVSCINIVGDVVDKNFCSHLKKPSTSDLCLLDEPKSEIIFAQHSDWSTYDQSTYRGQARYLWSEVQTFSQDLGEDCHRYRWLLGDWTKCMMSSGESSQCGLGTKTRKVLCVDQDLTPVSDFKCLTGDLPQFKMTCQLPCPINCQVSDWSPWSDCLPDICRLDKNGTKEGYRRRTRKVVREDKYGDLSCPHLIELHPCIYSPCYSWVTSHRPGDCRFKYSDMQCGEGTRNRSIECVSISGDDMPPRSCSDPRPSSLEVCHVACANDCVISGWSEWSPCSRKCSSGRGYGHRTRFKEVLAVSGQDGVSCPPHRMLLEKERCFDFSCVTYHWKIGPWAPCKVSSNFVSASSTTDHPASDPSKTCGSGHQYREVVCVRTPSGDKVGSRKCLGLNDAIPQSNRSCTLKCPAECLVSKFAEWSPCPVTCISDEAEFLPTQTRRRFIVRSPNPDPSSGTKSCPPLIETRLCMNLPRCPNVHWQVVTRWSRCVLRTMDRCGSGLRSREVRCVSNKRETVTDEECLEARLGRGPDRIHSCNIECQEGSQSRINSGVDLLSSDTWREHSCLFSMWNEWSACSRRCGGTKRRSRTLEYPHESSKQSDCDNVRRFPLDETENCPECPNYEVVMVGSWSSCIVDEDEEADVEDIGEFQKNLNHEGNTREGQTKSQNKLMNLLRPGKGFCGAGRRFHALACSEDGGRTNVSASVCGSEDFVKEMCFVLCPRDCKMSEWSEWSECSTKERCGSCTKSRSRYLVESSLDGGRECPQSIVNGEEQQTTYDQLPCESYEWRTGEWSSCVPISGRISTCDEGLRSRVVRCVRVSTNGEEEVRDDKHCDVMMKPGTSTYCHLPCPGHCVVSHWSTWIGCEEGCVSGKKRRRFRTVVRPPTILRQKSVGSCPHLEEFERCHNPGLAFCKSFKWKVAGWGNCLPVGINSTCGEGTRTRPVDCVRESDEAVVAWNFCRERRPERSKTERSLRQEIIKTESHGPSFRPDTEGSCYIPCPTDCVISEWLPWQQCPNKATGPQPGYQKRARLVVVHPGHGGRQCAEDALSQMKPCPFTEYFRWKVSEWSQCFVEEGSCGHGVEFRNVTCQSSEGSQVDEALCHPNMKSGFQTSRSCHVACPGDCSISPWSQWSPCNRPCHSELEGFQTRSRVIIHDVTRRDGLACGDDNDGDDDGGDDDDGDDDDKGNGKFIETRPCFGGFCPTFSWQLQSGNNSTDLLCRRSDGLIVYGACSESLKPGGFSGCEQDCSQVLHSHCHSTLQLCTCLPGFEPEYEMDRREEWWMNDMTDDDDDDDVYHSNNEKWRGKVVPSPLTLRKCTAVLFSEMLAAEGEEMFEGSLWLYVLLVSSVVIIVLFFLVLMAVRILFHKPKTLEETKRHTAVTYLPDDCYHNNLVYPGNQATSPLNLYTTLTSTHLMKQ